MSVDFDVDTRIVKFFKNKTEVLFDSEKKFTKWMYRKQNKMGLRWHLKIHL